MAAPEAITESDLYKRLSALMLAEGATDAKDDETVLADVLADLMYWAEENAANGVDFESALDRARGYYGERI